MFIVVKFGNLADNLNSFHKLNVVVFYIKIAVF